MRRQITRFLPLAIAALFLLVPVYLVAQGVSIEDQLKAQYQLVKMGADSSGAAVTDPGTLLDIQKGGILGVPFSDVTIMPTKYQDGQIHSPNSMVMKGLGSMFNKAKIENKQTNTRLFQVGEKVYPTRIEVNVPKDKVTMGIVSCDQCNNVNPPTYYKTDVVFQFGKGYLATANAGQVEDVIGQVFAIDNGDQGGGGNGGGNDQGGQGDGQGGGQGQNAQQQPEPQTIQLGQSIDDVTNAMGKPEKIVNLGAKQIYVYKDLKITFVKGKVTDVQ